MRNDKYSLPPVVWNQSETGRGLTRARVRAALRLVFDTGASDALVADAPDWLDDGALRRLIGRARARFGAELIRAKVLRWRGASDDRPLPAGGGAGVDAALALVLHVGLELDSSRVADLLDRSVDEVGADLLAARRAVDLSLPVPCREHAARVGRFRDRQMEPAERVALFTHLNGCERCQRVVEHAKGIDADLIDEVRRMNGEPIAPRSARARLASGLRGVGGAVALLLGLLVAGAAAVAIQSVFEDERQPIPIVVGQRPTGLTGWLIVATPRGNLEARNLATGEIRRLSDATSQAGAYSELSPDATRIATWTFGGGEPARVGVVVGDLQGNTLQALEWENEEVQRYPSGWLDSKTLLVGEYPIARSGESSDDMEQRAREAIALIGIDVASGDETILMRGEFGYGIAAPDGRSIAFVRSGQFYDGTIEVRPIENSRVGEPVATIDNRAILEGRMVWSADGGKLYLARVTDAQLQRNVPTPTAIRLPDEPIPRGFDQADFISIDRDGTIEHFADAPPGVTPAIISVSPDQRYLAYIGAAQQYQSDEPAPYAISVLDLYTGTTEILAGEHWSTGWLGVEGIWSPDSAVMLSAAALNSYLEATGDASASLGEVQMSGLTALRPGQEAQIVEVGYAWAGSLTAWLPEGALPAAPAPTYLDEPRFSVAESVGDAFEGRTIDERSSISPDGRYMVLTDGDPPAPLLLRRFEDRGRRLRTAVTDMTWLPNSSGAIGVTGPRPDEATPSRLMVFASEPFSGGSVQFDLRQFDPFEVGKRQHVRYGQPRTSPDGRYTSYFVVNAETRTTELWVVGVGREEKRVAAWTQPESALVDVPLVSAWVAPDTLLFVEPDDWSGELPQTARFMRLTIGVTTSVDALTDIVGRGDDRGIVLEEIVVSPDGKELAYRVRHYGERAVDRGRTDTLHVASTGDISQETELARGRIGYGMTWIDDGEWLAAGLRGQIAVLSARGLTVEYVTDEGADARYPIRIGPGEVWFAYDDGSGSRIMRVVTE